MIYNTASSLVLQVVTVVCGFILPRMILDAYGSAVNGLVQSITQFLSVISFLELGVGQVIQSALYSPLAKKDNIAVSQVLASGDKFFKRIAYLLLGYVAVLVCVYPLIIDKSFDWYFTAVLIVSISISSFAQYYFGIIDRLLLNADQMGYIQYISQIVAMILNTAAGVVLIQKGASIQLVKLTTATIYMLRPFIVRLYIRRHYTIDRKIKYEGEPIKQKWNGIAQHVSAFILNGTDNIVLTVFSTLENVSIYSVYHLIIYGIRQLYESATAGVHSMVGDLWAKQEIDRLNKVYGYIEMILHFSTVFIFSCTGILLFPFVSVYTNGIEDINYIQPAFGILLVIAYALQCLKTTYNILILASGDYKQTQSCHVISAALNLGLSIAGVLKFGIVGVALGTVISMAYQLIWMAWYDSKHILKWPFKNFIKQMGINSVTVVLIWGATSWIKLGAVTYVAWFIMAVKVAVIAMAIVGIMMYICYRERVTEFVKVVCKKE